MIILFHKNLNNIILKQKNLIPINSLLNKIKINNYHYHHKFHNKILQVLHININRNNKLNLN